MARRFYRVLSKATLAIAEAEGLTLAEPTVLASLHDAPATDEHRLAERIGADLASVQRMVKHLLSRGLIHRVDGPGRPHRRLSLTPEGLELFSRLYPVILSVKDEMMRCLSQPERETLLSLLARVITANEHNCRRHSR